MDSNNNSTQNATILCAANATAHTEIRADYSKEVRGKIDDVAKRKKFKEQSFDGKKTIKDPYINATLHMDRNAAKAKYGQNNTTKHTADVDHIIPAETVYEKTQNNPFLNTQDIKEIANQEGNYRLINSKTNRSKQSKSNIEYVIEHKDTLTKQQQREMIKDQIKADLVVNKEIAKKTIQGVNEVGMDAAKIGMKAGAGISVAQNITRVITGEQTWEQAGINVAVDTAKEGAVSYVSGIGTRVIESTAMQVSKSAGTYIASSANKFIKAGGPAKTLAVISDVGESVLKFINGDIDNKELTDELGAKGTSLAMSFAAGTQGATVGGFLGAIIGSVIPGAGTIAGSAIGATVGEIVGNMVGYMLGSEICRVLKDGVKEYNDNLERKKQLAEFYNQMAAEVEKSRIELEKSLQTAQVEHRTILENAFTSMRDAILDNNVDVIIDSLQTICEEFGTNVMFKTREECDAFMLDDSKIIKLGKRI